MEMTANLKLPTVPECVVYDLGRLNIPVYLSGYRQLCVAIPLFAVDDTQTMCTDLYPAVAKVLGHVDWRAVEYSIRRVILAAWKHRDPEVWEAYFPGFQKAPSNKQFIATLAQRMRQNQ